MQPAQSVAGEPNPENPVLSQVRQAQQLLYDQSAHCCLAWQGRWLPELQRIVRTISDDFGRNLRRLNCAGEVRCSLWVLSVGLH